MVKNSKKLDILYSRWKNEFNHGHNREFNEEWCEDVNDLFGNQDEFVNMYFEVFKKYKIKLKGKVLDVGSSMGGLAYSLLKTKKFNLVSGVDIDKTAIDMGKLYGKINKIKGIEFKTGSATKLDYKDNTFDLIFFKDVAEHLGNMNTLNLALKECRRVLKKNGILFIEAPNYFYPKEPHVKVFKLPYLTDKFTLKLLTKIFGRNTQFIDQLNFTNPFNLTKLLKKNEYREITDIYYDYRIEWKIKNIEKSNLPSKFLTKSFSLANKLGIGFLIGKGLKYSRLYPILWFIAKK